MQQQVATIIVKYKDIVVTKTKFLEFILMTNNIIVIIKSKDAPQSKKSVMDNLKFILFFYKATKILLNCFSVNNYVPFCEIFYVKN